MWPATRVTNRIVTVSLLVVVTVAVPTIFDTHSALACNYNVSGNPTNETVRPSYGEKAHLTASYSATGSGCVAVTNIVVDWADGSTNTSPPYQTSYTPPDHLYSAAVSKTYGVGEYLKGPNLGGGPITNVQVIGCPPSCLLTRG